MIKNRSPAVMRSKWFMPLFCLGLGVVVLAASWLGGQLGAPHRGGLAPVCGGRDLVAWPASPLPASP